MASDRAAREASAAPGIPTPSSPAPLFPASRT